ncbi:MAG TPA: BCD family MFS transporter [Bosea sp. (in: a-proteobacteria)]|jgi:BCD family chlorophyll transporter-like MFS transporter|uniref:BCD family MFS transporter n=1 Tax=Bosea sp. (in: a-proteobacteria) TaxID=1871050 RepID=UPI002DDD5260|nr:BCD family MFS transporter [Bosea sp. (in: a-proteobacteria)]HEV2552565.1 BCD family MFS transporter [Bosea sp. (in: a-proteobacteria)]
MTAPLGWLGIMRLGLVQTAIGAIVVLTTSTINRVMVVELALPAILPGLLVALHYAVQILRPRWGHGSDVGGRLTPWITGGMAVLALGGFGAAAATALMETAFWLGVLLAAASFAAIGMGVGASGTCLLILLSRRVADARRPAAATVVWVMMIAGFIVTAGLVGHVLDPFSTGRLVAVSGVVSALALAITVLAVRGVEGEGAAAVPDRTAPVDTSFRVALREVWDEPQARLFAIFIFVSMIAYSAQDLILEPFAGTVFGFTPGESTRLAGVQNGGVLAGMVLVAVVTTLGGSRAGSLRLWAVGGCLASALALTGLAMSAFAGADFPLRATVFALGLANGAYAVAAIGSMMRLVGQGKPERQGVRMGLWGAAQGVAFGLGGLCGAAATDLARQLAATPATAYAAVFAAEALLFVVAAGLALAVARQATERDRRARKDTDGFLLPNPG